MDPISTVVNKFNFYFVNQWMRAEYFAWPYIGVGIGLCVALAWLCRENWAGGSFLTIGLAAGLFEFGLYFGLPSISTTLVGEPTSLPENHLWFNLGGIVAGILFVWLIIRYCSPWFEKLTHLFTKTSSIERNRKTDIRQIGVHLPNSQRKYDPRDFFNIKRGIFFGLDEQRKPVYIPLEKWRKSHLDVIGTTGSGKGVAAAVLLTQALHTGESIVVIDPKNDEFLPHVLRDAAQDARVPYVYIDLSAKAPQWNPLQNKAEHEIEELFAAGFSLGEKGTDADFYRLDDRRAARIAANLAYSDSPTLANAHRMLLETQPEIAEAGKKFMSDLEEISLIPCTKIETGVDLAGLIQKGAVIYVRGSMRNPRILKLQRIFVLSIMQHIEARARESARHVCVFMDEFKYMISRPALEALGAIRDKRAHVMIAHQSLGDLRDCPADLDANSVVASVNENCAIKISYAVKDPDTADWLARMSGSILVDDEIRQVKTNIGLTEVRESARSLRQAERNLVDTNMLQALPERCAVLYGAGLARFFFTSPIPVSKSELATTPIRLEMKRSKSESGSGQFPLRKPQTVAQSMLDVD
jgi:hypothetical protein